MPTIELSSEVYRRVEEFTQVVRAVLNEDVDASTSLGILHADAPRTNHRTIWPALALSGRVEAHRAPRRLQMP